MTKLFTLAAAMMLAPVAWGQTETLTPIALTNADFESSDSYDFGAMPTGWNIPAQGWDTNQGWQIDGTAGKQNNYWQKTDGSAHYFHVWHTKYTGSIHYFDLWQEVTGLEAGTYRLTADLATSDEGDRNAAPTAPNGNFGLYASTSAENEIHAGMTAATFTKGSSIAFAPYSLDITVADGETLRLGVKMYGHQSMNILTFAADNFKLYKVETSATPSEAVDKTSLIDDAAVTDAEKWTNGEIKSGEKYNGAPDDYYFEHSGRTNTEIYQTVHLTPGIYQLKAATRGKNYAVSTSVFAEVGSKTYSTPGLLMENKGGELGNGWNWTVVDNIVVEEESDVRIGFVMNIRSGNSWAGADDFHLTYVRPLTNVNVDYTFAIPYGTLILPFDAVVPAGMEAYTCNAVGEDGILELEEVATMEANKPYIVKGTVGAQHTFSGIDSHTQHCFADGLLTGIHASQKAPVNSYVLQKHGDVYGFYRVAEGKQPTVGANRAFLTLPEGTPALARLRFGFDDEATGIKSVETAGGTAVMFDLMGRRASNKNEKGIYIINGKKILK